jgi:cysteine desulfurase family protein
MIYFDSAATSFQKPPTVGIAMQKALQTMSSPGRGGYPEAMRAAETALRCRTELQGLFHVETPEQVVFTLNATHALNIAIKTLVHPGCRVVISGYEHNAVTRPLNAIENVKIVVADSPLFQPAQALESFEKALRPGADAVICNHVSNVFGYVHPIEPIAELCKTYRVPLVIDASQSAGILPLNQKSLGAAFIAMPGHKGLYGPQGTGVLLCGRDVQPLPLMCGGTGSASVMQEMPDFLPDRLEAGTLNMPGIAGLLEGVKFVRKHGEASICAQERMLTALAVQELKKIPGMHVFARDDLYAQIGVLSILPNHTDVELLGTDLGANGIAVRTGLHCAPLAHQSAGTLKTGTVRLSFSAFSTPDEVHEFLKILKKVLRFNS